MMDQSLPKHTILTPFNYFEWKDKVVVIHRYKGLYRITIGLEIEPNSITKKSRWFYQMDESFDLLFLSISSNLQFHASWAKTPNEVWKKLEGLYMKQKKLWGYQLENDLIALRLGSFNTIYNFFTKFKLVFV